MEFERRKAATLATMYSPASDKSPKGSVDAPIIPLLNALNSHPSYFTTSSCSGRISVLSQPTAAVASTKKKAKGGTWVYVSHDPADPHSLLDLLFHSPESTQPSGSLVFRFEPLIIAVECRDVESAQSLVSLAISSGFRESGITSANKRVIVAIRCSIRLEVPLGDTHKTMVSPEYVEYLVRLANDKMSANQRRTDDFLTALLRNGFVESVRNIENRNFLVAEEELSNKDEALCIKSLLGNGGRKETVTGARIEDGRSCGSVGVQDVGLYVFPIGIVGENVERLHLWGHSACTLENIEGKTVLIFGGFGGIGRHARRNDSLVLDPVNGKLESINFSSAPSPRLGHTASVVGDSVFVIGGRVDPMTALNDVWVLNATKKEWRPLHSTGSAFPPSHRHAAAVVGSKIYVFGGIQNDVISSSFFVLDTDGLVWSEISAPGEWPCSRHSHSLVAYGSRLLLFGGYDGEKALGDLFSFDVQTCLWMKEKAAGRTPHARFSHSMFVYKNFVGIFGGCPVKQQSQELSLLDLHSSVWKHIKLNSTGKELFVRCTASVVNDELILAGGGVSCYAFGTKFSEPVRMNLLSLESMADSFKQPDKIEEEHNIRRSVSNLETNVGFLESSGIKLDDVSSIRAKNVIVPVSYVLRLEKKHAKPGKDVLKRYGWLDLGRKVYVEENGLHVCFPVTEEFYDLYDNNHRQLHEAVVTTSQLSFKTMSMKGICSSTSLKLLAAFGATIRTADLIKVKKPPISPLKVLNEAVGALVSHRNLRLELLEQLPKRWERLGDIVVLPVTSFQDPVWDSFGKELWLTVAESLGAQRLARQGQISPTGTRDSTLEMLVGDSGWVDHPENGIVYSFDATKCMFSWGNLSEKLRMAHLDCTDEVVVDLFAGIGYFVLPFLVRANAKLVYACDWNPHAIEGLKHNLRSNGVADRCIVLEGDNRDTAPKGVADRVCLGYLPTSEEGWVTAVRALRSKGGILHVHCNVKDSEEGKWAEQVCRSINDIAESEGYDWEVSVEHVERVKWYAPHIRHLVGDVQCQPRER